jgi:hypothetical protein
VPSASDVPSRYDVVINGEGYVLADVEEQKGAYGLTPTFVQRQNVQGDYGDSQQDFWLTYTARDFSRGEGLKFARPNEEEAAAKFYQGTSLDTNVEGEASLRHAVRSLTFAAAPVSMNAGSEFLYVTTSTTLYHVASDGTITSDGAHGLGAAPSRFGLALDQANVYLSTTTAGTVGVRRWSGAAFSTFSATGADSLAYLNNALYGISKTTGQFIRYDTAGVASTLYTWQTSNGTAITGVESKLVPFGGKLLILRYREASTRGSELWLYDGTAPAKIAEFPANFAAYECEVVAGAVFVSGYIARATAARPAIFVYTNGNLDLLWRAAGTVTNTGHSHSPGLASFDDGVLWNDDTRGQFTFYKPATGAISSVGAYTVANGNPIVTASGSHFIHTRNQVTGYQYPDTALVSAATITTPLIDFDSSLSKYFRTIRVDFDATSEVTNSSFDVEYAESLNPGVSFTSLTTGQPSGTEVPINLNRANLAFRVSLNRGHANNTYAAIKRIRVRAVPVQPDYKKRTYVLNCTGADVENLVRLRDGSSHTKDGLTMGTDLQTAASATAPFTITDAVGGYTGIIESLELKALRSEEFIAVVQCRSV